jgi:hypothetical protein
MTGQDVNEPSRAHGADLDRWPDRRYWVLSLCAAALCFALGFALTVSLAPPAGLPDASAALAIAGGDIGGLL